MNNLSSKRVGLLLCVPGLMWLSGAAWAATPAEIMNAYAAKGGSPPVAERGEKLFISKNKGGAFDSCTDCHTANPARAGRDQVAEKSIPALAPAGNAKRLTDALRVETAFRLNCKDVLSRECTAQEKADVMSWLIGLKP